MDGHFPGVAVCGEGLLSKGGNLREEEHFREVRVFHSNHTSNPPTDRIKGLGQVHKEDIQARIVLAAPSLA